MKREQMFCCLLKKWLSLSCLPFPFPPLAYSYQASTCAGVSTFVDVPLAVSVKQPGEEAPPSSVANLVFMVLLGFSVFYRKEVTTFVWKTLLKKEGDFAFGESVENMFRNLQRWQQSRKVITTSNNSSRK
jgi:hypothetical protein